jgi:hypothetical protein
MEEAPENGKESPHSAHANGSIDVGVWFNKSPYHLPGAVHCDISGIQNWTLYQQDILLGLDAAQAVAVKRHFWGTCCWGIGFAEMALHFCHAAQHHIPKDNVDNLKSHKFNILFLLHTVTVYLNQIITKCGCVVGILALCLVAPRFTSQCGDGLPCRLLVHFSSFPPSSCWIVEGVSFTATPGTSAVSHTGSLHISVRRMIAAPYLQLGLATSFHITSFLRHYLLFLQLFNAI